MAFEMIQKQSGNIYETIANGGEGASLRRQSDGTMAEEVISGAERIYVRSSADFGTIDSTKEYFIDGIVDMTGVSIEVPAGGINLSGYNFDLWCRPTPRR